MSHQLKPSDVESLNYDCIDQKPRDYDFSGENWAGGASSDSGWKAIQPVLPYCPSRGCDTYGNPLPSTVTDVDDCPTCGLGIEWREPEVGTSEYEEPMMNYAWPLPERYALDGADARELENLPVCIVEIDGKQALALTGGGMDLSWEIAEAYIRLGFYPPAHIRLPNMADKKADPNTRTTMQAMAYSYAGMRARSEGDCKSLTRLANEIGVKIKFEK